jgi:hypothetical protein
MDSVRLYDSLNFSNISLKFRVVAMFVIVYLKRYIFNCGQICDLFPYSISSV